MTTPSPGVPTTTRRLSRRLVAVVVPAAVAANVLGGVAQQALAAPLYLDMLGTAVAAIALGPWWGALVGALTNVGTALAVDAVFLPFIVVNVVGALAWGYGFHHLGLGRSVPRFAALNVAVGAVTAVASVPIVVLVFGGETGHVTEALAGALPTVEEGLFATVLAATLLLAVADRTVSGFAALLVIEALPDRATGGLDRIARSRRPRLAAAVGGLTAGAALAWAVAQLA